jgi:hypothetical protein
VAALVGSLCDVAVQTQGAASVRDASTPKGRRNGDTRLITRTAAPAIAITCRVGALKRQRSRGTVSEETGIRPQSVVKSERTSPCRSAPIPKQSAAECSVFAQRAFIYSRVSEYSQPNLKKTRLENIPSQGSCGYPLSHLGLVLRIEGLLPFRLRIDFSVADRKPHESARVNQIVTVLKASLTRR